MQWHCNFNKIGCSFSSQNCFITSLLVSWVLVTFVLASRSRSPVRRERSPVSEDRSQSPEPSKIRKHSTSPDQSSPRKRGDPAPGNDRLATLQDGSDYSDGPRGKSRSPASPARDRDEGGYDSPKANGHSRSPSRSPRDDDRSPIDEDDDNHRRSLSPWKALSDKMGSGCDPVCICFVYKMHSSLILWQLFMKTVLCMVFFRFLLVK